MDYAKLVPVLIEAASFIAAFAAIAAAIIMARFIRKFVTGILAMGFKTIGIGIFVLALGIIIDAVGIFYQIEFQFHGVFKIYRLSVVPVKPALLFKHTLLHEAHGYND